MRSFLRPLSLKMAITISLVIWFSLTPQIVELVLAASPSLDLNGDEETIFYQLGGPVPIDIDMTLEDDDDELYSIKVEILNIQDPGEEIILAKESNKVRIDSVEDGSNGVLTLSGTGNVIHYNSLLEGLQYQHTGEITSTVDRSIR
ncbi:hypothetical protein KC717_05100, partial [Candidatus Dojkabacteria bacterium]|nr:hypothetical protein [Candidatus Dojkabacteria bacterium]